MAEKTVYHFKVEAPRIAQKAKPGQFVVLRVNEKGERIPLTMASTDPKSGTIDIIFQVIGKTTALLSTLNVGDYILDVIGPLGRPTHVEKVGLVVCVGGGTGVAVMYPITKAYKEIGNEVIAIIGARTKDLLILEGDGRNEAELFRQFQPGAAASRAAAQRILYWPKTNRLKVEDARSLEIGQFSNGKNTK